METANMPDEVKEAWDILAEINDLLAGISQWSGNEADVAIKQLHGKWQKLCSETETARSGEFLKQCEAILAECDSFREKIVQQSQAFAENTKDKISLITKVIEDSKETKSLLEEILKLWNEIEQPRLVFLHEKTAELASGIMDMMEFAVQPVEAAAENSK